MACKFEPLPEIKTTRRVGAITQHHLQFQLALRPQPHLEFHQGAMRFRQDLLKCLCCYQVDLQVQLTPYLRHS